MKDESCTKDGAGNEDNHVEKATERVEGVQVLHLVGSEPDFKDTERYVDDH